MPASTTTAGNCLSIATGDCANSIQDVITDLLAGGFTPSPASLNIAGCALSGGVVTCNGTGFPINNTQSINIANGFSNDVTVYNAVGKVDFNVNQNNRISGMYFFGNNSGTVEDFPEYQSKWRRRNQPPAQGVGGGGTGDPPP